MTEEFEYKVESNAGFGIIPAGSTKDSRQAGKIHRHARESIESNGTGGTVELYRRRIGPWELVEKVEVPRKE